MDPYIEHRKVEMFSHKQGIGFCLVLRSFVSDRKVHLPYLTFISYRSKFEQRDTHHQRTPAKSIASIQIELELELIQTQMAQKPMLRAEVYAHAMRASQNRKKEVRREKKV